MEVAPFFVDFHHFLSIFTIFYRFSRFTHFCRNLHFVAIYALFPQFFFGQNSLLRNITRFLHVCIIIIISIVSSSINGKSLNGQSIDLTRLVNTDTDLSIHPSILWTRGQQIILKCFAKRTFPICGSWCAPPLPTPPQPSSYILNWERENLNKILVP